MHGGLKCTDMCRLADCDNQDASILDDKESSDVQGAELEDEIEDELNDADDYEFRLRLKHDFFPIIVTITVMIFSLSHLMRRRIYGLTAL